MEASTSNKPSGASSGSAYGSAAVVVMGFFETVFGLALLLNKSIVTTASGVIIGSGDLWGWVLVVLGAATLITGLGMATSLAWRGAAIGLAVVVAISQVATITLFPIFSALIVGLSLATIYILSREE